MTNLTLQKKRINCANHKHQFVPVSTEDHDLLQHFINSDYIAIDEGLLEKLEFIAELHNCTITII